MDKSAYSVDYSTYQSKLLIILRKDWGTKMSKVDRTITKSQTVIKIAVTELMAEKSFDDITIQDIDDRANVNRETIYLHYTDKKEETYMMRNIGFFHISNLFRCYRNRSY